ncbi:MAG: hypothetical protein ACKOOF_05595 [Planctomycetaceae bacterium]
MGSSPTHCIAIVCLLLACIVGGGMPAPAEPPASGAASGGDSIAALPTTVRVAAAHAYLRAGPSDDFYPTERLTCGTPVEVWAFGESGYCAVRPVRGSSSWMRRCDVECPTASASAGVTPAPIAGVVVTDGAIARVGSQLNDLRHVTQVALEAGERVTVIESVTIPEGRHAGEWVRIEPPAGEFRWARVEDLALPPELAGAIEPVEPPAGAGLAAAGDAIAAIRDAGHAVQQAVAEMNAPAGEQAAARGNHDQPLQPIAGQAVAPAGEPAQPSLLNPLPLATKMFAGWLPRGTNVFDGQGSVVPTAVSAGAAATSADELTDIDLALSLAVAGPTESWNLAPLRERLRLAAARATSESERTRAVAVDARLARFEAIQARQKALAADQPADASSLQLGGMWSSLSALGSRPVRPGVLPGGAPAGGQPTWTPPDQIETTGRLATVISRRPDAPRWALVDGQNNVLVFVTPQPGVNLAPLVGQQVSVRGAKGYMPEYKRPYLVATEARTRIASVPMPTGAGGDTTQ